MDSLDVSQSERYRRWLHDKFNDFLSDKDVRGMFKNDHDKLDLLLSSKTILNSSSNKVDMRFLKDLEFKLKKLIELYEDIKNKSKDVSNFQCDDDDNDEDFDNNNDDPVVQTELQNKYVCFKKIKWRMPKKISYSITKQKSKHDHNHLSAIANLNNHNQNQQVPVQFNQSESSSSNHSPNPSNQKMPNPFNQQTQQLLQNSSSQQQLLFPVVQNWPYMGGAMMPNSFATAQSLHSMIFMNQNVSQTSNFYSGVPLINKGQEIPNLVAASQNFSSLNSQQALLNHLQNSLNQNQQKILSSSSFYNSLTTPALPQSSNANRPPRNFSQNQSRFYDKNNYYRNSNFDSNMKYPKHSLSNNIKNRIHPRFGNVGSGRSYLNLNKNRQRNENDRDKIDNNHPQSYREYKRRKEEERKRKEMEEKKQREREERKRQFLKERAKRVEEENRKLNLSKNKEDEKRNILSFDDRAESSAASRVPKHSQKQFQSNKLETSTSASKTSPPNASQRKQIESDLVAHKSNDNIEAFPNKNQNNDYNQHLIDLETVSKSIMEEKDYEKIKKSELQNQDGNNDDDNETVIMEKSFEMQNTDVNENLPEKEGDTTNIPIKQEIIEDDIPDRSVSSGKSYDSDDEDVKVPTSVLNKYLSMENSYSENINEIKPKFIIKKEIKEEPNESEQETIYNSSNEADTSASEVPERDDILKSPNESFYQTLDAMSKDKEFLILFKNAKPCLNYSNDFFENSNEKVKSWIESIGNLSPNYDQPEDSPLNENENAREGSDCWLPQGDYFDSEDDDIIPYQPFSQISSPPSQESL